MKAVVILILLLLATALTKALTVEDLSAYLRDHPNDSTYSELRSLLMNGMLTWDASSTTGVSYRVYYGSTAGKPSQYRDIGTAKTFALPYWLTGSSYYVSVVAVKGKLESQKSDELRMERIK